MVKANPSNQECLTDLYDAISAQLKKADAMLVLMMLSSDASAQPSREELASAAWAVRDFVQMIQADVITMYRRASTAAKLAAGGTDA